MSDQVPAAWQVRCEAWPERQLPGSGEIDRRLAARMLWLGFSVIRRVRDRSLNVSNDALQ
jgi:hypothetical protein